MPTRIWSRLREMFYWKRGFAGNKSPNSEFVLAWREIFFKSSTLPSSRKTSREDCKLKKAEIENSPCLQFCFWLHITLAAKEKFILRRREVGEEHQSDEKSISEAKTRKCFNSRRSDKPRRAKQNSSEVRERMLSQRSVESSWNFRELGAPHSMVAVIGIFVRVNHRHTWLDGLLKGRPWRNSIHSRRRFNKILPRRSQPRFYDATFVDEGSAGTKSES